MLRSSPRESLFQAIKFTILSLSAGRGIEALSFLGLDKLTALSYDAKHVISIVLSGPLELHLE